MRQCHRRTSRAASAGATIYDCESPCVTCTVAALPPAAARRRLLIARAVAPLRRGLRLHLLLLLVLHGTTQVGRKAEKQKHHHSCCTPPAPAPLTARSCCSQIAHYHRVLGVLGRPPAQSGHQTGALSTCPLLMANSCQLAKPCIGTAAACRPWHYSSR